MKDARLMSRFKYISGGNSNNQRQSDAFFWFVLIAMSITLSSTLLIPANSGGKHAVWTLSSR
jgi:hypothetical protein